MEEIDLCFKILVFVKILSQGRWKEEGQEFRSLEVREASSSHLKMKANLQLFKKQKLELKFVLLSSSQILLHQKC